MLDNVRPVRSLVKSLGIPFSADNGCVTVCVYNMFVGRGEIEETTTVEGGINLKRSREEAEVQV